MSLPEKNEIVAQWFIGDYDRGICRARRPHYLYLGPTGPRASSYWVMETGWLANNKKIRVRPEFVKTLVTREKWDENWLREQKEYEQKKIMEILAA